MTVAFVRTRPWWEERDLVAAFGSTYLDYRARADAHPESVGSTLCRRPIGGEGGCHDPLSCFPRRLRIGGVRAAQWREHTTNE
jgi:hypothetical protein